MSKYKDPDSWKYGGIKKRDFSQSHDGPEEMPHKKKSKKVGRKRARCEHEYEVTNETNFTTYKSVMTYIDYKCSKCGRKDFKMIITN